MSVRAQRQTWRGLAVTTVVGVLLSVALQDATFGGPALPECNSTAAPICNGTCYGGRVCAPDQGNACACQPTGCCIEWGAQNWVCSEGTQSACNGSYAQWTENGTCGTCVLPVEPPAPTGCCIAWVSGSWVCSEGTQSACNGSYAQWTENGTCGTCLLPVGPPLPTETPTVPATATPTRVPDGGSCADPADCVSGNCVDDVCCDTACNGSQESCNQPGHVGVCTPLVAPAPAVTSVGMVLLLAALTGIAALAIWRRRA